MITLIVCFICVIVLLYLSGRRCGDEVKPWIYREDTITDGFGNHWSRKCPECGGDIHVVRPGKVQCSRCE